MVVKQTQSQQLGYLGDDQITGSEGPDYLGGNEGDDTIISGKGNDVLLGGAGNDTLDGAAGDDILRGGDGDDLLLTGSGDDILFGEAGNDTLRISGTGFSTLDGGDGSDTLLLDMTNYTPTIDDFVTDINLVTGIAGALGVQSELADQLISIENIDYRGPIASQLTGNDEDNVISGGDGNDTLSGGSGNDQLDGGDGDDTLDGGDGEDALDYSSSTSLVLLDASLGNATDGLGGADTFQNIEVFYGSSYNDEFIGKATDETVSIELNALDGDVRNYEQFRGNDGADYIDGGGGYDELSYTNATFGLTIDLAKTLQADGLGNIDTILNIEGVEATKYDDLIYGTEGGNSLDGRFGNNTIDGRGGFDFVEYNGASRHNLELNLSTGVATFTKGTDGTLFTDNLANIEGVIGSDNDDIIVGDSTDNKLYGGAGNDTLDGG